MMKKSPFWLSGDRQVAMWRLETKNEAFNIEDLEIEQENYVRR